MANKINKILSSRVAQWLVYKFIRIYSLSFRLEVQNEIRWLDDYLQKNSSIILCVHHQQFFPAIRYFQKYRKFKPGLMISKSRDGEFISAVANRSGWTTVRGSSSKGGLAALEKLVEHLRQNRLAAHIIDGPRGPFGMVKPGAIRLAHATDSIIVPIYVAAERAWYARSWDRFMIPKPFSRVVLRFGEKLKFDPTQDGEKFEQQRKVLENTMAEENQALLDELKKA